MVRAHDEISKLREALLGNQYKVVFDTPTPVTGGGTVGYIECHIEDMTGVEIEAEVTFDFGVFTTAKCITFSTNATLNNASKGIIEDGAGGAGLTVTSGTDGHFKCEVTNMVDETVCFGTAPAFCSPILDHTSTTSLTFSA